MATHYRTRGFIIKKADRGEADQVFTIYTDGYGKLKILGKAIRKVASKLKSGAGLFYLSDIEFIQGKNHKTLTDAVLIDKFSGVRSDLSKLKIAYQIAETMDALAPAEEKDPKIWGLLNEAFLKLNNWRIENSLKIDNWKLKIIYYYFFWNFIALLGYQPELKALDKDIARILELIFQRNWQVISKLKLEDQHLQLLNNISRCYYRKYEE